MANKLRKMPGDKNAPGTRHNAYRIQNCKQIKIIGN